MCSLPRLHRPGCWKFTAVFPGIPSLIKGNSSLNCHLGIPTKDLLQREAFHKSEFILQHVLKLKGDFKRERSPNTKALELGLQRSDVDFLASKADFGKTGAKRPVRNSGIAGGQPAVALCSAPTGLVFSSGSEAHFWVKKTISLV